ncbi:hypothetical protein [Sphingopyxis sp. PET50]|uniref:hypothetical protein n=1 Tax=Sphingopyxis sp. PET50 TaxID=2976533 RepID=UPI0021AEA235|nr:hypothetical protein [Sphingopyxis sp. PET50]
MLLAAASPAQPYVPPFDPGKLKDHVAGEPGEALVLGTPHLSGLPDSFDPANLEPLLARLAAWKPQIVTIEGVSGPDCERLLRYKPLYPDAFDDYCWDPAPAQKALGLDMPAATVEAERLLAAWPAEPAPAGRRHLAAVFLAGGEPAVGAGPVAAITGGRAARGRRPRRGARGAARHAVEAAQREFPDRFGPRGAAGS